MTGCRTLRVNATSFALGVVTCAALGCGGSPPVAQAPAATERPPAAPPAPSFDLSPIDAPATLFVSGRLANPSASLATVHGWSNLPMPQSAQLTEALIGDAVGPLVDLSRPIDFAIALGTSGPKKRGWSGTVADAKPRLVVSAALENPETAKEALSERHKLVPAGNGAFTIVPVGEPSHRDDGFDGDEGGDSDGGWGERSCEIAPAYGDAAMRLVCSWGGAQALGELGPWLTRGATRATSKADLHLDVAMQPLKAAIADRLRMVISLVGGLVAGSIGLPGPRDLIMSAIADLGDFVLDLDTAALDVELSDPVARAIKTLKFSATSSAIARMVTANADRNGTPPAALWQMPRDTNFAFFSRGVDPSAFGRGRELVLKAVADQLEQDGIKPGDRTPIVEALGQLPSSAPWVWAAGFDDDIFKRAVAVLDAQRHRDSEAERFAALREATRATAGWHIFEIDEPAARMAAAMSSLAAAWNRGPVVAAYRARGKGSPPPRLRALPMPKRTDGAAWPTSALHYVLEIAPPASSSPPAKGATGRGAPEALAVHAFLVGDGARSWVGIGVDDSLVAAKLEAAIAGSGETLGSKDGLGPLQNATTGAGGFFTLRGLASAVLPAAALAGEAKSPASDLFDELALLPHRGTIPVVFWMTPQPAKASPSAVTSTVQVPRAAIEDIIVVGLRHGL